MIWSEEAKRKLSLIKVGKPNLKLRGRIVSKETRQKLSTMARQERRLEISRRNILKVVWPSKDTKIEVIAQESLARVGIPFITHSIIGSLTRPDILLLDSKVVIFVDGCYWHGCPIHHPNTKGPALEHKLRDNPIRSKLSEMGYIVIQVWEHELIADHDALIHKLEPLKLMRAVLFSRGGGRKR